MNKNDLWEGDTPEGRMAQDGYKACPYCAEPIRLQATVCRYCGRDLQPVKQPSLDLGAGKKKTGCATYGCLEWGVLGIIGLVVLAVFGRIGSGTNSTVTRPTSAPRVVIAPTLAATTIPEPTKIPDPTVTATPEWMAPSFEEMCHRDSSMTDAQFDEYVKTFTGKKFFDWDGWVYDVYESGGVYKLLIAMDKPGIIFWSRDIEIDDIGQELGRSLGKEQMIRFSGTIQEVGTFAGGPCNPLRVKDAEISKLTENGAGPVNNGPIAAAQVVIAPTLAPTASAGPTATPEPTATARPEWMAPSFKEICHRDSSLTDVQFEEYVKTFAGKKFFDWDGWVYDVRRYGEEYELLVAMDAPTGQSFSWIRDIETDDIGQELGVSLSKEQPIRFSGTIQEVGTFWGDGCNPLKVKDVEIILR